MKKKYVFKPYSKRFPILYEKERERIAFHLKVLITMEHVGSTAIEGMGGKGIIDIAIVAHPDDFPSLSHHLKSLGYEFRESFSTPDRWYFINDLPDEEEGMRRYHIHLMNKKKNEWKEMVGFRDYLRTHPVEAKAYEEIKKEAVNVVNEEGAKYRALKDPMFKEILSKIKFS